MTYNDKRRFSNMAEDYDAMVCYLLPKYDDLQDEMIKISGLESAEKPIVVDLFMKFHLWSMIGGQKREAPPSTI